MKKIGFLGSGFALYGYLKYFSLKKCNLYTLEKYKTIIKKRSDLNRIYVNLGPGKFTSLRISLSIAKAISFSNKAVLFGFKSKNAIGNKKPREGGLFIKINVYEIAMGYFN